MLIFLLVCGIVLCGAAVFITGVLIGICAALAYGCAQAKAYVFLGSVLMLIGGLVAIASPIAMYR